MRKATVLLAVVFVLMMAGGAMAATTTFWLSTSATGAPVVNEITVPTNTDVQLYCFLNTDAVGNVFEAMVGYDTSDATTYGAGKDTNNGAAKKLTLVSTGPQIYGGMDTTRFGGVFTSATQAVVLDASGREASNASLGGRPYGFVARLASPTQGMGASNVRCFSFTLHNAMPAGQYQYVVVSNYTGGNSYSSAWKYGTSLSEGSFVLKVNSGSGASLPTVGTSNKNAVNTGIMATAASKYNWVMWGRVSARDNNGFKIDDGSGLLIQVVAPGNTVANNDYVSVKGSLNPATTPPTLTATEVVKR